MSKYPKWLWLQPYLKPVLWANTNLQQRFNTDQPIGEAWLISVIPNCEATITNPEYQGMKLSTFFDQHRPFFSDYQGQYPNLTKIIDAKTALSIQVHPDDHYAQQYNSLGKAEAWYVLKNAGTPLVLGTTAKSKAHLAEIIKQNKVGSYLLKTQVVPGDFVYIDHGQVHAIASQTMVYEIQQSSDLTFRLYDYDRLDVNGQLRPLHIKEALDVVNCDLRPTIIKNQNQLVDNHLFHLKKIVHVGKQQEKYQISQKFYWAEIVIVAGTGYLDQYPVQFADALLLNGCYQNFTISGDLTLLINLVLVR